MGTAKAKEEGGYEHLHLKQLFIIFLVRKWQRLLDVLDESVFWLTFGSSIWKTLCLISCDCRLRKLCIVFL